MPIENYVPRTPVLVYDGSNSAEFVSLWEGQGAPVTSAEATIQSETGGVLTLRLDADVNSVPTVSEGIFVLSEGDGITNYLTWYKESPDPAVRFTVITAAELAEQWVLEA